MSFICGFFNSVNGDRKYNAEQMNNPYKRIISNGVFAQSDGTPSNDFQVLSVSGMSIKVHTGEGVFAGKWAKLDADMSFNIPMAHVTNPRIDSVIIKIDESAEVRAGSIIYKEGTPSANPTPPAIERSTYVTEYRLANIRVEANATSITQSKITDTRIGSDCGFSTHLLKQYDFTATYAQFTAEFEEWFATVKETLATATLIRSYTSSYTTATQGETVIPINILQFNYALDILQVFVNGLRLIPNEEYTINSNSQITLTKDLDIGQQVSFIVYKSVDGSEAETVVQQVYELQQIQVTANGGGVKRNVIVGGNVLNEFISMGSGFHTMYSPAGAVNTPKNAAFRYFGHMTSSTNGWIIAMQADGSVYSNYLVGGEWKGWRTIHEVSPTALYYSENGVYPNPNVVITPTKKLSECQHGWQLVFNAYQDGSLDSYVQSVLLPKRSNNNANWNGENVVFPLTLMSDTVKTIFKQFQCYDDRLVSNSINSTSTMKVMVLRAIYEY